jgi:hypothetical protein
MKAKMKRANRANASANAMRTYYKLPADCYGQPLGYVVEVFMTPAEYERRRSAEWLYEDYAVALWRGQD